MTAQDSGLKAQGLFKKSIVREYFESIVIAVILALFIRTFVVQAFKIPTGSTLYRSSRTVRALTIVGASSWTRCRS